MVAEVDTGEIKREAIRDRYVPLMAPLFFPDEPTKPDIIQLFASLLRVVGMEDKGWDPYAESRNVLDDLKTLMQLKLPAKIFKDRELTAWRLGLLFYSHIVEMSAAYEVLTNLLRFRLGKGYHPNPYYAFIRENDRKRYRRSGLFPKQKIEIIQTLSKESGLDFGGIFDEFYRNDFRNAITRRSSTFPSPLRSALDVSLQKSAMQARGAQNALARKVRKGREVPRRDGVSSVDGSTACYRLGAVIHSLPQASLPLGSSVRPPLWSTLPGYAALNAVPCRSIACMMMASRRARAIRALRMVDRWRAKSSRRTLRPPARTAPMSISTTPPGTSATLCCGSSHLARAW
jgi:hypothetical protein